ncbi:hypothetical protein ACU6U9_17775 [Pseudomonas sp. HK3]
MTIKSKDDMGVCAECPNCHAVIMHGFQVCQECGHLVSAEDQQTLKDSLKNNVVSFMIVAVFCIALIIYVANIYTA